MSITADLARADETLILLDLWQLYMRDLATYRDSVIQTDGRYRDDRLRTYLAYDDHWSYLIRNRGEFVGFALTRKSKPDTHVIGEFFIKSEFRSSGIGRCTVAEILSRFAGNWEIPFQEENVKAANFWRRTITELGYETTEANLLNDVLLSFTIANTK